MSNTLPLLEDDYVGAWFTPQELRARNQELAKLGRRICKTHQGAALPLDEAHFYYSKRALGQFNTECKRCSHQRTVRQRRVRYHHDESFREHESERKRQWYRRRRLAHIKQVLGAAS